MFDVEGFQGYVCELALSDEPLELYAETFRLGIKYGADLSPLVRKATGEELDGIARDIVSMYKSEAVKLVQEYAPADYGELGYWRLALLSACAKYLNANGGDGGVIYDMFRGAAAEYVQKLYSPGILNDDDADILPSLHRFGYYAGRGGGYGGEYAFALKKECGD